MIESSPTTKISREMEVPGYLLDEQILRQVDKVAREAVGESEAADPNNADDLAKSHYVLSTVAKESIPFDSLDRLLEGLERTVDGIRSVSLRYTRRRQAGIDIVFSAEGEIRLSGFSPDADFQFNVNQLHEILLTTREDYSWAIKSLVFQRNTKRVCSVLLVVLSVCLLATIGYYFEATRIGVNIDPSLLPRGNEYLQNIARAIKSNDTNEKLNALLLANLTGFTNVSDVLTSLRVAIRTLVAGIACVLVLLGARKVGRGLYPRSFFLFGRNRKIYTALHGKRQMWGIAVIVGFIVNVAAGIAVVILTR
jgi:hypothetical protein